MANGWQGMNWIRKEKRLAIYLRDHLACVYCGEGIEDGATLTLDHLRPRSKGGTNRESNLVTSCERCNKARQDRSLRGFCSGVEEYLGIGSRGEIEKRVRRLARRRLDLDAAKRMIEDRGFPQSGKYITTTTA